MQGEHDKELDDVLDEIVLEDIDDNTIEDSTIEDEILEEIEDDDLDEVVSVSLANGLPVVEESILLDDDDLFNTEDYLRMDEDSLGLDEISVDDLLLEGEENLQLTDGSIDSEESDFVPDSYESKVGLELSREQSIKIVVSNSVKAVNKSNLESYNSINDVAISNLKTVIEPQKLRKISEEISSNKDIPFLTNSVCNIVRKIVLNVTDITPKFARELMDSPELGLSQDVRNNEVNYFLFYKYCKDVFNTCRDNIEQNAASTSLVKSVSLQVIKSLNQEQDSIFKFSEYRNKNKTIFKNIKLGRHKSTWTCGKCGKEHDEYGYYISFVKTNKYDKQVSYLLCDDCDSVNILPLKGLSKLTKIVKPRLRELGTINKDNLFIDANLYYPSNEELITSMPDIFSLDIEPIVKHKDTVNLDWNLAVREYIENVKMFYTSGKMDKSVLTKVGIKNMAKILAEMTDSYDELKEKALASLLQEIKNPETLIMGYTFRESLKIPSLYKDKFNIYKDYMFNQLKKNSDNSSSEEFKKEYEDYCSSCSLLDYTYENYIEQLKACSYFYGYVPISNFILSDEDRKSYLSDSRLVSVLDDITDFMIINHLGENFIKFYTPRTFTGKISARDSGFARALKELVNLVYVNNMDKGLEKFCTFANKVIKSVNKKAPSIDYKDFVVRYIQDYNFFIDLSKLSNSLITRDYYQAVKERDYLISNYKKLIDELGSSKIFKIINDVIMKLPIRNKVHTTSKFDYYFSDNQSFRNMDDKDKEIVMSLYDKKKKAPLNTKSIKEYNDIEDFSNLEFYRDEEIDRFIDNNYITIYSLKSMSNSINAEDFITYNLGKDFLVSLSNYGIEEVASVLGINVDICKLNTECEYNINIEELPTAELVKSLYFNNPEIMNKLSDKSIDILSLREMLDSNLEEMYADSEGMEKVTGIVKAFDNINVKVNNDLSSNRR